MRVHRRQVVRAPEGLGERVWRLERLPAARGDGPRGLELRCRKSPTTSGTTSRSRARRGRFSSSTRGGRRRSHARPGDSSPLTITRCASWWPVAGSGGAAAEMIAPSLAAFGRRQRRGSLAGARCRRPRSSGGRPRRAALPAGMLGGRGRRPRLGPALVARRQPGLRREREIADLGAELDDLGRRLAERWGCDPAGHRRGLAARRSIGECFGHAASQPDRLALHSRSLPLGRANPVVARLDASQEPMPSEPRLRILIAEVQARCGAVVRRDRRHSARRKADAPECTPQAAAGRRAAGSKPERSLRASAGRLRPGGTRPRTGPSRAALAWCAEPDVSGAQRDLGRRARPASRPKSDEAPPRSRRSRPAGYRPAHDRAQPRRSSFRSRFTGAPARSSSSGAIATLPRSSRRLASETDAKSLGMLGGLGPRPGTPRAKAATRSSRPFTRRAKPKRRGSRSASSTP